MTTSDIRNTKKKRLEIVHLRLFEPGPLDVLEEISQSIDPQSGQAIVRVYRHGTVTTDVAIHIHLEPETIDRHLTELGLRLANALKTYGMVEHNTWFEV